MSKTYFQNKRYDTSIVRRNIKNHYINKFYNLWFNSYKWNGLNYQQRDYIMKKFWKVGRVGAFELPHASDVGLLDNDKLAFSDFVAREYNIYMNYPIRVGITPEKWAPFLPKGDLKVDKDIVIGYCQRNQLSIYQSIETLIDYIVDAEMLINIIKDTLKLPFMVIVSEEDKARMKALMESILNDETVLYLDAIDAQNIKTMNNANPYILDKVYQYKKDRENEILTYLGIDNVASEKKEHLIVDEVNANNDVINNSGDCCLNCLEEFVERINNVFNLSLSVEATAKPIVSEYNNNEDDEEE